MTDELEQAQEEISLDDLFSLQRDEEAIKQTEQELLIPVGTYTTIPELKITTKKNKHGRPYAMVSGKVKVGQKDRFFPRFFVSWERKNKLDAEGNDTGQADRQYKNYVMLDKAFRTASDRSGSVGEILTYLKDYPVRLRIIQLTDSGENMVVAISPVIDRS